MCWWSGPRAYERNARAFSPSSVARPFFDAAITAAFAVCPSESQFHASGAFRRLLCSTRLKSINPEKGRKRHAYHFALLDDGKKALAISAFAALAFAAGAERQAAAQNAAFQFAAIGDTAYTIKGETEFDRTLAAMNKEGLAFVVHIGDFEADPRPYTRSPDKISMPCTDESLFARARFI
jgi:hypothetical protein